MMDAVAVDWVALMATVAEWLLLMDMATAQVRW